MTAKDLMLWLVENSSMQAPVAVRLTNGDLREINPEDFYFDVLDDSRVALVL